MNENKKSFHIKYGNTKMLQDVFDNTDVNDLSWHQTALIQNPQLSSDQITKIIRGTESNTMREVITDAHNFGPEHIEQMLNDGASPHHTRQVLAAHPKLTDSQAKRFLDDPHELEHIKQTVLKFTKSKDVLEHGMNHPKLGWSAKLGILRNTSMTKDMHSRLLKDPDGMIRFMAMKHDMSTPEEIQHYIDHEPKEESEDDSFHHAREHLERKQAHQRILAARAELKANKELKEDVEPELKIDIAKEEDMKDVMKIEQGFPKSPWKNPESFKKPDHKLLVAKKDDKVVGYIYTKHTQAEKDHLVKMMVHEDHQGQGIENALMKTLTRPTSLNVRKSNKKALSLYANHGFRVVKTIPKMYKNGEDAIHMIKDFT